jgi:DNA-binding MarR family transcriptional regulator
LAARSAHQRQQRAAVGRGALRQKNIKNGLGAHFESRPVDWEWFVSVVNLKRVVRKRKAVERARERPDKHEYFVGVAEARYVLRKAFRIVEEQAKAAGIDPLAHQVLIQVYGSPCAELPVNRIAERLDITPAFASNLVTSLVRNGLVTRRRDKSDQRVSFVAVTDAGKKLLSRIDEQVKFHVDYFTAQLTDSERESALSILMFYIGETRSLALQ